MTEEDTDFLYPNRGDSSILTERSDSTIGIFAECPACGEVIDPE
jgi:predicted RNA-binding Zn-ribbon protein involved in translation (DUF1610 family)